MQFSYLSHILSSKSRPPTHGRSVGTSRTLLNEQEILPIATFRDLVVAVGKSLFKCVTNHNSEPEQTTLTRLDAYKVQPITTSRRLFVRIAESCYNYTLSCDSPRISLQPKTLQELSELDRIFELAEYAYVLNGITQQRALSHLLVFEQDDDKGLLADLDDLSAKCSALISEAQACLSTTPADFAPLDYVNEFQPQEFENPIRESYILFDPFFSLAKRAQEVAEYMSRAELVEMLIEDCFIVELVRGE
jgi:hypothetical protein